MWACSVGVGHASRTLLARMGLGTEGYVSVNLLLSGHIQEKPDDP